MTVRDLIIELSLHDPDAIVVATKWSDYNSIIKVEGREMFENSGGWYQEKYDKLYKDKDIKLVTCVVLEV